MEPVLKVYDVIPSHKFTADADHPVHFKSHLFADYERFERISGFLTISIRKNFYVHIQ